MTATPVKRAVVVIPCSGIGKTYGSVSREAAFILAEELRPGQTQLVALSRLVLGDDTALQSLTGQPVVTIDGCKLACATKMVNQVRGEVDQAFAVLDVYRRYKQFKPQGISTLSEGGQKLAHALAQEVAAAIDELASPISEGGQNG